MSVEIRKSTLATMSPEPAEKPAVETPVAGAATEKPVEGAPATETPPGKVAGEEVPGEGVEKTPEELAAAALASAYKPREKFKVMDKDIDVPPWLKSIMKDADSEKQVIELLEKSHGLDVVKPKLAEVRTERDQYKQNLGDITGQINEIRDIYAKGDIDLWLEKLQVPQEKMLRWALDKVNYSKLTPEQQQLHDDRVNATRKSWDAEKRANSTTADSQEKLRQAKATLLDASLAGEQSKAFADAYDAQAGKPGAFRSAVIDRAELAFIQSNGKTDLTPEQAVQQTMEAFKPFVQVKPPAAAAAPVVTPPGTVTPPVAVIPNVTGKGGSPLKTPVKSIAEIKQRAKEARGG